MPMMLKNFSSSGLELKLGGVMFMHSAINRYMFCDMACVQGAVHCLYLPYRLGFWHRPCCCLCWLFIDASMDISLSCRHILLSCDLLCELHVIMQLISLCNNVLISWGSVNHHCVFLQVTDFQGERQASASVHGFICDPPESEKQAIEAISGHMAGYFGTLGEDHEGSGRANLLAYLVSPVRGVCPACDGDVLDVQDGTVVCGDGEFMMLL